MTQLSTDQIIRLINHDICEMSKDIEQIQKDLIDLDNRITNIEDSFSASRALGSIGVDIDGMGQVPTIGQKGYVRVPYHAVITGWSIVSDGSGSCVFDIWKSTVYPTNLDAICIFNKPTLTNSNSASAVVDGSSGWITEINAGDIIGWYLESVSGITGCILQLTVVKL